MAPAGHSAREEFLGGPATSRERPSAGPVVQVDPLAETGPRALGTAGGPGFICDRDCTQLADARLVIADLRSVQDRYMRLLTTERKRDDRTRATARRYASDRATWHWDLIGERRLADIEHPVLSVLRRVKQLPDRPSLPDLDGLRKAADLTGHALEVARSRSEPDVVRRINGLHDEVTRLRAYIIAVGRELHTQFGPQQEPHVGCVCRGCEFILGADSGQPVERRGDP